MSMRTQSWPEAELIRSVIVDGDRECFAELFMRHRKNVYYSCRRFFGEQRAAEDATQETFLRAWRDRSAFQGGDFSDWLMRIARNICIDEYRKNRPETSIDGRWRRFVTLHGHRDRLTGLFLAAALAIEEVRACWLIRRGTRV